MTEVPMSHLASQYCLNFMFASHQSSRWEWIVGGQRVHDEIVKVLICWELGSFFILLFLLVVVVVAVMVVVVLILS